jgi:hypothetical protein
VLSYQEATRGGPMAYSPVRNPDYQEAEMAYERLDEALRQLKKDRERAEVTENQQKGGMKKPGSGSRELSPR